MPHGYLGARGPGLTSMSPHSMRMRKLNDLVSACLVALMNVKLARNDAWKLVAASAAKGTEQLLVRFRSMFFPLWLLIMFHATSRKAKQKSVYLGTKRLSIRFGMSAQ